MRRSMVVGLFVLLILGVAAPAWAQDAQTTEAFVVLSGRADVPQGQQVGDLVVFHGSSTVDGTVDGSLTAFDAPVTISGRVNGDVVAFNGRVVLRSGATVTGDVEIFDEGLLHELGGKLVELWRAGHEPTLTARPARMCRSAM